MELLNYLTNLMQGGTITAPTTHAEQIRNAARALGRPACTGAYDANTNAVVIYLDRR